jgi:hypothetical protein
MKKRRLSKIAATCDDPLRLLGIDSQESVHRLYCTKNPQTLHKNVMTYVQKQLKKTFTTISLVPQDEGVYLSFPVEDEESMAAVRELIGANVTLDKVSSTMRGLCEVAALVNVRSLLSGESNGR